MSDVTKTFPVHGSMNVMVRIGHGSLTITAQDDLTEARVTLAPRKGSGAILDRTAVEMRGDTLAIVSPRQGGIFDLPIFAGRTRESEALDVAVVIPSGSAVKVSGFTADITIAGRVGMTDLAFGSSTVHVDTVDGDLRLRFGSGAVRVERVHGSAVTRSGSGTVHLGEVDGTLMSAFGSGDLTVDRAKGLVRSRSGSGKATINAVYADVDLASGSGGMTIGLPAGTSAQFDVASGRAGLIETEMPIEDAPTAKGKPITVRVRTGSGNVRVVRAA